MPMRRVKRTAISLKPKQPYIAWANGLEAGGVKIGKDFTPEETIYLIEDTVDLTLGLETLLEPLGGGVVCAWNKVHAAVCQGDVVQGNPDRDRIARIEGPVGVIQMPGGGVGPGLFNERLVVPDTDAIDASQFQRNLPQMRIQHQLSHARMVLPQIDALDEHVVIVGIAAVPAIIGQLPIFAADNCLIHRFSPGGQFSLGQKFRND